jgi:transcriptional regulator with XRE-family HTH domain
MVQTVTDVIAGVAGRLREARDRSGKTVDEVALAIGISVAAYADIEAYDDEFSMALSLEQIWRLARALEIPLTELIGLTSPDCLDATDSMDALLEHVRAAVATRRESIEHFGDRVGWDIASAIDAPARAWSDWNLDCLRAVCEEVSCDWRSILCTGRPLDVSS